MTFHYKYTETMLCLCSTHLVNCTFHQMCCSADQFINCAAFDQLHNIWSIAQRTCNRVSVRVKVRIRVKVTIRIWVSFKVRVRVRLTQLAKWAAHLVKRAARLVKHVDWPNAPYITSTWNFARCNFPSAGWINIWQALFSVRHPNSTPINANPNPTHNPNHNHNPQTPGWKTAWSRSNCPSLAGM